MLFLLRILICAPSISNNYDEYSVEFYNKDNILCKEFYEKLTISSTERNIEDVWKEKPSSSYFYINSNGLMKLRTPINFFTFQNYKTCFISGFLNDSKKYTIFGEVSSFYSKIFLITNIN